jgi:hypothetical protein
VSYAASALAAAGFVVPEVKPTPTTTARIVVGGPRAVAGVSVVGTF